MGVRHRIVWQGLYLTVNQMSHVSIQACSHTRLRGFPKDMGVHVFRSRYTKETHNSISQLRKALPHAMKWTIFLSLRSSRSIADCRRSSRVSPQKSQQCGQSATHNGISAYTLVIFIVVMTIRNIQEHILVTYHMQVCYCP